MPIMAQASHDKVDTAREPYQRVRDSGQRAPTNLKKRRSGRVGLISPRDPGRRRVRRIRVPRHPLRPGPRPTLFRSRHPPSLP